MTSILRELFRRYCVDLVSFPGGEGVDGCVKLP
jgi:hypothetical protein